MTQVAPNWLGSFFGSDLSFQDCEVLTIQNIPRTELRGEAELMQTKWFDYRRVHPMQATYHFMECYKVAYQDFIRKAVDSEKSPFMKPIKGEDFLQSREKLSFWRLRMLADKLGVRYDFFLGRIMNWYTEECFRRSSLYAPRPGQIASNDEALASMMLEWEDELSIRLQVPADTHYRISNWMGSNNQLAYEKFAVEQIYMRQHKQYSLSTFIYTHDSLRIEKALTEFGGDLVSEAISVSFAD